MEVDQLFNPDGTSQVGQEYIERLNLELGVIEEMGYPVYFLIVADFIRWSRENGIPVGPGRGSGAGSLVAWATGITEINPLLYGLLFERFLNPERVSLPDFDIDFCVDGRDRVIEYVAQRYGHDQVAQIITFGTMAAKAVVRDVGRVMSLPYGFVDQIAKLIPFVPGMTLDNALAQEQLLRQRYEEEEDVQELIDSALQLEGIARNVGKHAGGVVIAPRPLTEYTPLYADSHLNQAITQLDKDNHSRFRGKNG
jgi:DNA polymerase-3 subunit alpha